MDQWECWWGVEGNCKLVSLISLGKVTDIDLRTYECAIKRGHEQIQLSTFNNPDYCHSVSQPF
jgi:hypothetical protein